MMGQKEEKEKKLIDERKERRFCLKNYKRYLLSKVVRE
jgi:hypothetical protein